MIKAKVARQRTGPEPRSALGAPLILANKDPFVIQIHQRKRLQHRCELLMARQVNQGKSGTATRKSRSSIGSWHSPYSRQQGPARGQPQGLARNSLTATSRSTTLARAQATDNLAQGGRKRTSIGPVPVFDCSTTLETLLPGSGNALKRLRLLIRPQGFGRHGIGGYAGF